ncbi:nudix hydrolase 8 [Aplysia californica]|uniref:Nudix hydrolase 8 n=1 Tax=Aplysia californica TaxID=6500 RepID=A0ABM0JML0_APLCA|nr:nudix hydrolase 8 [Aplysia californica]
MADQIIYSLDRFSSVHVDTEKQQVRGQDFITSLRDALPTWRAKGHRGVWVTVQKELSACIPQLIELGFDYHHAEPGYAMLTIWLPETLPNNLPAYANHYLGVAGFVVNEKNQVLVVRERYHNTNLRSPWKLPGGHADRGEEISTTAEREVFEETGVKSEFVCVIAFRHLHNYRFGLSDFYFVCLMRSLSSEIKACPNEIAECEWMDLEDYENYEKISDVNRFFVQQYREIVASGNAITPHDVRSYDRISWNKVYSADRLVEQDRDGQPAVSSVVSSALPPSAASDSSTAEGNQVLQQEKGEEEGSI